MLGGAAGRFCTPSSVAGPFRLCAVTGFQNRTNDIVYCPPLIRGNDEESTAVVYFGGDVQDFPESMETNRDSRGYMKYNLESTAALLRNGFPRFHIIVIRPVRMEFKTFSCFDNFVRGNNAGVPDHTPMNHALQHLEKLLQNISIRLKSLPDNEIVAQVASTSSASNSAPNNDGSQDMDIDILQVQDTVTVHAEDAMVFPCREETNNVITSIHSNASATNDIIQNNIHFSSADCQNLQMNKNNHMWWKDNVNLDKSKLILIGFSKGCVVLNQFIYEFHYLKTLTPDDSTMIRLLSRIREMYWLDGGHGGQKNTWITSRSLLETLTRLGINIHVHVTPYQVQDDRRPWIRKEEKIFTDMLRRLGAPVTRQLHFDSTAANLFTHFEVLQAFCQHIQMHNQQQHQMQGQQQQQHRTITDPVNDVK
ncbi:unnamed protein product [Hermetia illucens]|uniref:Uncharacterized protein n=1 Tax=Hermetia illucens TaxID=343691 RepID=A0A7R8UMX0_HERIL|nr:UPF0565 protein C2orf69 homolog [Hermetia illucens]XP_037912634.1 UPF0565 protein C2orf69 homolog [Hermetia illucens]CAD7083822.1 unnamed protein product [Hermetia illucens]